MTPDPSDRVTLSSVAEPDQSPAAMKALEVSGCEPQAPLVPTWSLNMLQEGCPVRFCTATADILPQEATANLRRTRRGCSQNKGHISVS